MLVFESKLRGEKAQYAALDEALRTGLFVRNKALRYWMDGWGKTRHDLNKYCRQLASEFSWAKKLNSMARQAMAERAWSAISRFFDNCKKKVPGKKGFPKFRRHQTRLSVEYKTSGWQLSECRRYITFTDGFKAGTFKLWGTRDLHFYQLSRTRGANSFRPLDMSAQIKRVRVVRRADGYYCQFCLDVDRVERREPTGKTIGLDVGLNHFYSDSDGEKVENPRYLRKSEKALKREQRRLSHKQKGSKNRVKARNRWGRKHLKVQRQRRDFAVKLARSVALSNDVIAFEDLKVRNLVKNHNLAQSITDASWSMFRQWLEYFGKVFGVVTVAVPPQNTSQKCSGCQQVVKKSLSTRTHRCSCGTVLCRDTNAAINILKIGLRTQGHWGTHACGHDHLCTQNGNGLEVSGVVEAGNLSSDVRNPRPQNLHEASSFMKVLGRGGCQLDKYTLFPNSLK
jgi:putative transposase